MAVISPCCHWRSALWQCCISFPKLVYPVQMDAAGFLFLALLSVYFANPTSPHMPYPWPSAVYATCQHLLPLMIMAGCMPWFAHMPGISPFQLRTFMLAWIAALPGFRFTLH